MADILRSASAVWSGDLRSGKGKTSAASGLFTDAAYSFGTRFENSPGSNPEELIAAAHAACYSMAFANELSKKGYKVESIATTATTVLSPKEGGGFRVAKMKLEVEGKVPGLDASAFQHEAEMADKACPISALLRPGVDAIEVVAHLNN